MSEQAPAIAGIAALAVDCHDPPGLVIDFLRVPEAKSVKNRLHLDLRSTDLAAATEQAVALGATRADDVYDQGVWQVLRDPEGNEFCLLRPQT
jgi:predicted enzyme related to lactoylglutathione lyase